MSISHRDIKADNLIYDPQTRFVKVGLFRYVTFLRVQLSSSTSDSPFTPPKSQNLRSFVGACRIRLPSFSLQRLVSTTATSRFNYTATVVNMYFSRMRPNQSIFGLWAFCFISCLLEFSRLMAELPWKLKLTFAEGLTSPRRALAAT